MTPELWQRLKPLYEVALETPEEKRAQFVSEACQGDTELRQELMALLAGSDEHTCSFDAPLINLRDLFPAQQSTLCEGELILGRFKIVRHLGSGGMGDVYEANDLDLELGRIALKTIRPAIAENPEILSRFKEEVILARQVSGPNVCRIHELFVPQEQSGVKCAAFLTMEYLEGTTLADKIAQGGPLPVKAAYQIAVQLCAALQSIHDAKVIHRDLKPRNIMLVPHNGAERVVVMDFGLARALLSESPTGETALTVPGVIMGTPAYMAPEQFEGREVSPATDIYALGIVLYELVTARQPFAARTPFAAAVRRGRRPDSPSSIRHGVPPVWDDVIARCLEYDPERRFQSAHEVINALNQHQLVLWRFRQGQRIALSRLGFFATTIVFLALLMVAVGFWRLPLGYKPPPPEVAHWYDLGMTALREGTYLKATRAFAMAIQLDQKFPLAHARLAEAWAELDFTGPAEREMLIAAAPGQERRLADLDKKYIDAVRTTLIRDYSAAAQDYEAILKALPPDKKGQGYVDLGRAYEKAGRLSETVASYEKAARMSPDDPAPFVHLGILKSRMRNPTAAEAAFNKAEGLYQAESNLEGLAEVAYQRGYAANEAAASEQARQYLDKSLSIARQIPSVQLEVRTLSQLSSLEYSSGNVDKGIEYANQAIQLARENGLEYWSIDGLMRLGNAYMLKEDFARAESTLQQALHLARQNQHPRLEAGAQFSLASIRDQQGKWDEEIAFAQDALKYYRDFGFMNPAADASTLIVRAQEAKGDFTQALQSGMKLLQLAEKTQSELHIETAEETVGGVLHDLEEYPSALAHYESALKASRSTHENEAYQALHCADALWRLGRYRDAEEMLASLPAEARKRTDISSDIENIRAQMLLSQGQYRGALEGSRKALQALPGMPAGKIADLERAEALAEAHLGQVEPAQRDADQLLLLARKEADEGMIAGAQLVEADVSLRSHLPEKAIEMAGAANQYFSSKGEKESEWLSLFYLAEAYKASGDETTSAKKALQSIDILSNVEQSWGSPAFRQYTTRPDHQLALRELSILKDH